MEDQNPLAESIFISRGRSSFEARSDYEFRTNEIRVERKTDVDLFQRVLADPSDQFHYVFLRF